MPTIKDDLEQGPPMTAHHLTANHPTNTTGAEEVGAGQEQATAAPISTSHAQSSGVVPQWWRRVHGLPPHGTWFWTAAPMLAAMQARHGDGGFAVAWDKKARDKNDGAKMYGFYASMEDFYKSLLTLPAGRRHGYEFILEDTPCRAYADVEWEGEHDAKHEKIRALVRRLRGYCLKTHQCSTEPVVSCSTRVKDEITGRWKNSYHVVITNLVFDNNHDGVMHAFWCRFRNECLSGDEWYWHKMKDAMLLNLPGRMKKEKLLTPPFLEGF